MKQRVLTLAMAWALACSLIGAGQGALAGPNFKITRVQLYFANNRAETTVRLNEPELRINADLGFEGSGLFLGYWEVDGRKVATLSHHMTDFNQMVTLVSPKSAVLPTSTLGTHRVRLVITRPIQRIAYPTAVYFVTSQAPARKVAITLISPQKGQKVDPDAAIFRWQKAEGIVSYCISFYGKPKDKPLFSACLTGMGYKAPPLAMNRALNRGGTYYWRVTGINREGDVAGESKLQGFELSF